MSRPGVVVIVRTKGERGALLLEAVESVLRQTYPHVSCHVVWDMPTPKDPGAFANAWWSELEAFVTAKGPGPELGRTAAVEHTFPQPAPCGRAQAGNEGFRMSRRYRSATLVPDLVGFLDDDDVLLPGWASRLAMALEADRTAGAAHCDVQVVHCDPKNRAIRLGHCYEGPFTTEQLREGNRTPNNAWLFRRGVLLYDKEPLRTEDEPCEDYGLLLRLARRGVTFRHAPGVGAHYKIRGNAASNTPREDMHAATARVRAAYGG